MAQLRTLSWNKHDDEIVAASLWQMMRTLPATLALVARVAWQANKTAVLTAVAVQVVSGVASAFALLALTQVLSALFAPGSAVERMLAALPIIAVVAALSAVRGLADAAMSAATARLSPSVLRRAERDLIVATSRVELASFHEPDFYDSLTRARYRGMDHMERAVEQSMTLLGSAISLVAAAAMVTVLHWLLLPLLALSVVPEAWATLRSARLEHRSVMRMIETRRRFSLHMDLLAEPEPAAEVRAFTAHNALLAEQARLSQIMEAEKIRLGYRQAATTLMGRALAGVGIALTYLTLGWLLYLTVLPLAVAGAAVVGIRTVRASLTQAVLALNRLFEQSLYINDYRDFLTDAHVRTRATTGVHAPPNPHRIDLHEVWFSYPGADQPALRGITMTIHKGQVIALVGENGSGKSTLAKLLAGLYLPSQGTITWDGMDLADVDEDSIADRVAVVMQDPARWPLTARRNVTLGRADRHDPDDRVLTQVAHDSGTDRVIDTLSHGWDSLLTTRFRDGHNLSGGQWQRISIARALYRDAPILICDEPTAALDPKAEAAVYNSLRHLQTGRTVFLITHRLASVRHADQIVVLHHGKIIQTGTHDDLMTAPNTHYRQLYELQAKAYQQDHTPSTTDDQPRAVNA